MERIGYYEERERTLSPPISPNYPANFVGLDPIQAMVQRTICIDRIYRLGWMVSAIDSTCFAAARLFDRCMSVMRPPIARTNMMLLAIACFDIVYKAIDSDYTLPTLDTYYTQALCSHSNDYAMPFERFGAKILEVEITVLRAVSGEPVCPTAQDYMSECCPSWFVSEGADRLHGRRASLLCGAFLYMCPSTIYTSEQIAASAARLEIGDQPSPSIAITVLCGKISREEAWDIGQMMVNAVDKLFSAGRGSAMYFTYRDIHAMWSADQKK